MYIKLCARKASFGKSGHICRCIIGCEQIIFNICTDKIHKIIQFIQLFPQFTDTLKIYPSPVYKMININWSAVGFLPNLQNHDWNNGNNGGNQWVLET